MSPAPAPRVRYHVQVLDSHTGKPVAKVLEADEVIAWVEGFATALGEEEHLAAISPSAPEDTRRLQSLQIGDSQGWFSYFYPEFPEA